MGLSILKLSGHRENQKCYCQYGGEGHLPTKIAYHYPDERCIEGNPDEAMARHHHEIVEKLAVHTIKEQKNLSVHLL